MRKLLFVAIILLVACKGGKNNSAAVDQIDTTQMMLQRISQCSKLYTTEYHIHKIITHDDKLSLKGSIMNAPFNINLPLGQRQIAIPMDATVKGYIDMGSITANDIRRDGKKLTIYLPEPKVALTSSSIDHNEVKRYVALMRSDFSDADLSNYERQGREQIVKSLPLADIQADACRSAANVLIPMMTAFGYRQTDITITFRHDLTPDGIAISNAIEAPAETNRP